MDLPSPLLKATLDKRYKRFLADARLEDGTEITAHCANPGSMTGLAEPGSTIWLSTSDNPKRKLKYSWELTETSGGLVGINTAHPNRIVGEAIGAGTIKELTGYDSCRPEVKYGTKSRIDFLLEDASKPPCYVEVKNVHLRREGRLAEFPDSVTARGTKHLGELVKMTQSGARAVMIYLVQRMDCDHFRPAGDIDPTYANAFREAAQAGVEMLCYACEINLQSITIAKALPIEMDA